MSAPIPWYYIWSPKYEAFHHLLMNCVMDCSGFVMRPQWFPQSAFTKPVGSEDCHFFAGNTLKFKRILEKMSSPEIPENTRFILSDADLLVFDAIRFHALCTSATDDVICMLDNLDSPDLNLGLMLCRNTPALRAYFSELVSRIEATGSQDQLLVNTTIKASGLTYSTFPTHDVIQSNMRGEVAKQTFCVLQMLCSNGPYEQNMFEKLLTAVHYFDLTMVIRFIPPYVLEALVLFCRDHIPSNPLATLRMENE